MATLTEAQKRFLVKRLAVFRTPTQAAQDLEEEFGVSISRQQANWYNPTTGDERNTPAERWVQLFHATREGWRDAHYDEALSSLRYRLRELRRILEQAVEAERFDTALQALKQAAKDEGGAFRNVRILEHSGRDGGPIRMERPMSKDEKAEAIEELLEHARSRSGATAGPSSNGDRR